MSQNVKRYIVFSEDRDAFPSAPQINKAFSLIDTLSAEFKLKKQVTLLVETKDSFPDRAISEALSAHVCRILKNPSKEFILYNSMRLCLHTPITVKNIRDHEIVLAYCPYEKSFDVLNSVFAKAIIVVPYNQETAQDWLNTWDGVVEVDSLGQQPHFPIRYADLDSRMSALTARIKPIAKLTIHDKVNLSIIASFLPPNTYPVRDIESSATRNGWAPKEAKKLAKIFGIRE